MVSGYRHSILGSLALLLVGVPSSTWAWVNQETEAREDKGKYVIHAEKRIERGELDPVLSCDGGALTLYTEREEKRNVYLLLRNQGIVKHLYSRDAFSTEMDREWYVSSDHSAALLSGATMEGIFDASDFHRVEGSNGYEYDRVYWKAEREGAGLKLRFDYVSPFRYWVELHQCERNAVGRCVRRWRPHHVDHNYHERANWYFRDCQRE